MCRHFAYVIGRERFYMRIFVMYPRKSIKYELKYTYIIKEKEILCFKKCSQRCWNNKNQNF